MLPVVIVTDSAACVPAEFVRQYGIEIVPYQLIWDGQVYLDGQDMAPDEFYRRLRSSRTYPTTATPTLGQFAALYTRVMERAETIVAIMTTKTLTATVDVAKTAARELGLQDRVVVIDAQTAGPAQAFIVLAAARAAHRGAAVDQVVAIAKAHRERVGMLFSLEDLKYLHRGGRIGQAAGLLGSRLHIQPVLTLAEGIVRPVMVAPTRKGALARMMARLHRLVDHKPIRAGVFHADALPEALELGRRVQEEFACLEFFIADFTPVMGAHTGPGIIGIAYCLEEDA